LGKGVLTIGGLFVPNPTQGPVCLLLHTRHCFNGIEEKFPTGTDRASAMTAQTSNPNLVNKSTEMKAKCIPFFGIFNVSVNKETVHFRMYVFHGNLEAIETAGFCNLHFLAKSLHLVVIKHTFLKLEENHLQ
jgi:hypothetical protein